MPQPSRVRLYASLAAVYLIWGSAFAVSKFIASDLPPFLASALRFVGAGVLLVSIARWRGQKPPRTSREWRHVVVLGVLQMVLSAGVNLLAIRYVASNQSALLNASGALWIPILGALGRRGHPLTWRVSSGIALGFLGVATLLWPRSGFSFSHLGWQLTIVFACLAWGMGTIYFRRTRIETPMLMLTGLNMLAASVILGSLGVGFHEGPLWHWHASSLAAIAYMAIFSSCIGYTAFNYLARYTSPAVASTYAYVNPAIATLVGWLALGESLSATQLEAMVIVLLGVVLVSLGELGNPGARATPTEPST
jgi:drug/metabolite transporter (DMT)-like permease